MSMAATQDYMTEVVWLPTYAGVSLLLLSVFDVGTIGIFAALITCRFFLELVYDLIFGAAKHELRTKLVAFASQVVIWGTVWVWYAQRVTSGN